MPYLCDCGCGSTNQYYCGTIAWLTELGEWCDGCNAHHAPHN